MPAQQTGAGQDGEGLKTTPELARDSVARGVQGANRHLDLLLTRDRSQRTIEVL
jgi:hypothetical protein